MRHLFITSLERAGASPRNGSDTGKALGYSSYTGRLHARRTTRLQRGDQVVAGAAGWQPTRHCHIAREVGHVEVVEFSGTACGFQTAEDDSLRWLLVQARRMTPIGEAYQLVVPNHVFAFSTWPGEGCEVANFGLAFYPDTVVSMEGTLPTGLSGWSWESFCKTQYASNSDAGGMADFVHCHLTVDRLLDRAKAMSILESVKDEGHFWENRDVKALGHRGTHFLTLKSDCRALG